MRVTKRNLFFLVANVAILVLCAEFVGRFFNDLDWPRGSSMVGASFKPNFCLGLAVTLTFAGFCNAVYFVPVVLHSLFRDINLNTKRNAIGGLAISCMSLWLAILLYDFTLLGLLF